VVARAAKDACLNLPAYHIHIEGQVQGVGFRPFVYQLARRFGLAGWVNNTVDGVHIEIESEAGEGEAFYKELIASPPILSRITSHSIREIQPCGFADFRIVKSDDSGEARLLLSPDFGLCPDCRHEILDPGDRRHHYPFITCIHCGPRYSIINRLPYDREHTTMDPFRMCPECQSEYDDPSDRRYYSQTNSCPHCSIRLALFSNERVLLSEEPEKAIDIAANSLQAGKIIAAKGIGGYLLLADATNLQALLHLRERKHRPSKPFALMYPDLETLQKDAFVREEEARQFQSTESPILLLDLKPEPASGICTEEIAPGLGQIGAMRPYAPLFYLLMKEMGGPLVATSANLSNAPIVFRDADAFRDLGNIADLFLVHNREIVIPQDDSVMRFTEDHRQQIVIRRSRGFAPTLVHPAFFTHKETVLAMGADLKSAFTLLHSGNTYVSQYLGDLESFDTQENYRHTLQHLLAVFNSRPKVILADLHPAYFSRRFGKELATEWEVPLTAVQHHVAHFAAVLEENDLADQQEPVLGLIWDGTGWGNDGNIWGGEIFRFDQGEIRRTGHFDYFSHILGDKMPREPRISALALCHGLDQAEEILRSKFTGTEWPVYQQILKKEGNLQSASVGRIFDGLASLLGIADKISYEGEAAMWLEGLAREFIRKDGIPTGGYLEKAECQTGVPTNLLMQRILADLHKGTERGRVAACFHITLAEAAGFLAEAAGTTQVAFSGGVFQNALLVDLLIEKHSEQYTLHFHRALSPNDECIGFGQLAFYLNGWRELPSE
jgi:hydrogenase maturation protein HypF